MMEKKYQYSLMIAIFTIMLFLSFYSNFWGVVDQKWFEGYQIDSESLVIGRVMKSSQEGIMSNGGFLTRTKDGYTLQKDYYINQIDSEYVVYPQQIGLQGMFFSVIDNVTNFPPNINLKVFYSINCIILSLLIMVMYRYIYNEFGSISALVFIITCIINPWLVVSARNLYWVMWTLLLPYITILMLMKYDEKNKGVSGKVLFFGAFISIFIKSACGFEFISTILISIEVPIIYYAIKNKFSFKEWFLKSMYVGLGGILGFITAIIVYLVQAINYFGSLSRAIDNFAYTIAKRTGAFNIEVSEVYQNSLDVSIWEVLYNYIFREDNIFLNWSMSYLIGIAIIMMIVTLVYYNKGKKGIIAQRKTLALGISIWVSIIGPLSWFILAKGHSYIHIKINQILWSLPSTLLIFSMMGVYISYFCYEIHIVRWFKGLGRRYKAIYVGSLIAIVGLTFAVADKEALENVKIIKTVIEKGDHLIEGNIDLYHYQGRLYYITSDIEQTRDRFFLHFVPKETKELPQNRIQYGFDNYDFDFEKEYLKVPFYSRNLKCAEIEIPHYAIKSIRTGQFKDKEKLWQKEISLTEYYKNKKELEINLASLTDSNWNNGISVNQKILLLEGNDLMNSVLEDMEVISKKNIKIEKVDFKKNWTHVILENKLEDTERTLKVQYREQ